MADRDVVGIDRLFPTRRSQWLVFGLVPACISAFWGAVEYVPQLWPGTPTPVLLLWATVATLATASGMLILLVIDLCLVTQRAEHNRIIHENYISPYMNFKMLYANATFKHWGSLAFFGAVCFALGYGYANIP